MKMKLFVLLFISVSLLAQSSIEPSLPPTSVAVTDNALAIFSNPAALGYRSGFQFFTLFPFKENEFTGEFGSYFRIGNLGFSGEWLESPEDFYQKWQLAVGIPVWKWANIGGTRRWFGTVEYRSEYDFGIIARPFPSLSVGSVIKNIGGANEFPRLGQFGIGLRPFGERFTIAADISQNLTDMDEVLSKRLYIDIEPILGVNLSVLYFTDEQDFRLGLNVNMRSFGYGFTQHNGSENEEIGGSLFFHKSSLLYHTIFKKRGELVLKMKLSGTITEEPTPFFRGKFNSLKGLIDALDEIGQRPDVKAILIELGAFGAGFTKLTEIRNAILKLREKGKKVFCYTESLGNGTYFLASACDKIFLNPAGTVWIAGTRATSIFFKRLFDKVGIKAEFEYIGAYKSAREPFTRDSMSDADREQTNVLLDDFFSVYVEAISKSRGMNINEVKDLINTGIHTAPQALKNGLVDDLIYEDEIDAKLEKILGKKPIIKSFKKEYKRGPYQTAWQYPSQSKNKIALIYAVGGITSGKSSRGFAMQVMGSQTIAKAIKEAREDKSVKAIVFRIDSPGGSALASDVIWREVLLTTTGKDKKPFIVSMSDVAASGGYYIACAADTIVALPTTITGSIGVLGGKLVFSGLLDKIGINTEIIERGDFASALSSLRSFTDEERKKIKEIIEWAYDDFTNHVAEGRSMSQDSVKKVGEGRVWSGLRAKEIGLVDELGGLEKALEIAKESAGIKKEEEVVLKILPKRWSSFIEFKLSTFFSKQSEFEKLIPAEYEQAIAYFNTWLMNNNEKALMIMPYWIVIE